jgi:thymidylate synthase (FAD)
MNLKFESRVVPVQMSFPDMDAIKALADEFSPEGYHDFEEDATATELLPIFAGRVCYMSFGSKAGRKTAADYLSHIKDVKHFSIIEHSTISFFIDGVSRSFSHEVVRHRHLSPSQLSQRFVAPEELTFVVPRRYKDSPGKIEQLKDGFAYATWIYKELLKEETPDMSFLEKKRIREAAREILPNATETKAVFTGNFRAWAEMIHKRADTPADLQIQEVAVKVNNHLANIAPHIFDRIESEVA